jgi:hypothetical protein
MNNQTQMPNDHSLNLQAQVHHRQLFLFLQWLAKLAGSRVARQRSVLSKYGFAFHQEYTTRTGTCKISTTKEKDTRNCQKLERVINANVFFLVTNHSTHKRSGSVISCRSSSGRTDTAVSSLVLPNCFHLGAFTPVSTYKPVSLSHFCCKY